MKSGRRDGTTYASASRSAAARAAGHAAGSDALRAAISSGRWCINLLGLTLSQIGARNRSTGTAPAAIADFTALRASRMRACLALMLRRCLAPPCRRHTSTPTLVHAIRLHPGCVHLAAWSKLLKRLRARLASVPGILPRLLAEFGAARTRGPVGVGLLATGTLPYVRAGTNLGRVLAGVYLGVARRSVIWDKRGGDVSP